jgi:hypothetical protein
MHVLMAGHDDRRRREPARPEQVTMAPLALSEMLRRRHRSLETRIATLQVDDRSRRARVVQLAEELVAHATVEQLVVYPYAEQLLGVSELALGIEHALDALLGVVGGIDSDRDFGVALARLATVFERHVDSDEMSIMPMVEALGDPDQLVRIGQTIEEFERAMASCRHEGPGFWPDTAGDVVAKSGGSN